MKKITFFIISTLAILPPCSAATSRATDLEGSWTAFVDTYVDASTHSPKLRPTFHAQLLKQP